MKNENSPRPRLRYDAWEGSYPSHWLLFGMAWVSYVLAFFQRGPLPELAVGFWTLFYAVNFPLQLRHLRVRPEGGDPRRGARLLAVGSWPYPLFLLLWPELTTRLGLLMIFPVLAVSGAVVIWLAWREEGPGPAAEPLQPPDRADSP